MPTLSSLTLEALLCPDIAAADPDTITGVITSWRGFTLHEPKQLVIQGSGARLLASVFARGARLNTSELLLPSFKRDP